jgi:LPS O-antigen subunit length determinant protein (WzzB/FepE family)
MIDNNTSMAPKPLADDEIDLMALAKTVWGGRKTIIIAVMVGALLGVVIAITASKEYTASTVMVPQVGGESQSKLGGLSSLASLAGISLDMTQSAEISPMVYPQIVNSIPFQLELMNAPLNFEEISKPVSFYDYSTSYNKPSVIGAIEKYTIGLPGVIIKAIKGSPKTLSLPGGDQGNQPILLTEKQYEVKKLLDEMVVLDVNAKEGYLTLTARMPEAVAAAQMAQKAQSLLQQYITDFKIQKVKANLDFIQSRYNETKAEMEKAQMNLAMVTDRGRDFVSGVPRLETDRSQTRFTIAFSVFQELAKQLEQAKIQVKKETPVFTIIKPVTVPSERSKPKRSMILAIWIFLGGIAGVGIIFGKQYYAALKEKWNDIPEEAITKAEQVTVEETNDEKVE